MMSQTSTSPVTMATGVSKENKQHHLLLRKSSSSKMALKEKIVQIYEAFFRGEDPSAGNANFWEEIFLLKVNTQFIENEFEKLNGEQLQSLKENINMLFDRCLITLQEDNPIRMANALQTICALIKGMFKKNLGDNGFELIDILVGFDSAEQQMQRLVESINNYLTGDFSVTLKSLALKLLLVLVTATDNVSQNTLLEYIMNNSVFEAIIQMLASPIARVNHGHDAVLLLTILVQYRKYESANPYIVKLSILDDELALNGYAQVVASSLTEFNRQYQIKTSEPPGGFFATLSNMVGGFFVGEEKTLEAVKANDSILLALYEAVHLNRNFITTLTHSHTPSTPTTPPASPTTPTTPKSPSKEATSQSGQKFDLSSLAESVSHPTNLLVTFLEYASIITQDTKDATRYNNGKLCLTILTCVAEDQYANSLMHDVNMNFRVPLHKTPMRHRKITVDRKPPSRPLACAVLDLMVEFIQSHMMKNLPMELHLSVFVCHLLLRQ